MLLQVMCGDTDGAKGVTAEETLNTLRWSLKNKQNLDREIWKRDLLVDFLWSLILFSETGIIYFRFLSLKLNWGVSQRRDLLRIKIRPWLSLEVLLCGKTFWQQSELFGAKMFAPVAPVWWKNTVSTKGDNDRKLRKILILNS